jgi:intracellular sulfur oxidation DsrE/DsrF family protein
MVSASRGLLLICAVILGGFAVSSAQRPDAKPERKTHRAVIEVTTEAAQQWESVLNNVENMQKAFAPDTTEIEVVAHGKGLGMIQKANVAQSERLAKIAATGVKFAACENTMRRMKVQKADLFDFVVTTDSGVAEVVRKQEAGWAYLKGGG